MGLKNHFVDLSNKESRNFLQKKKYIVMHCIIIPCKWRYIVECFVHWILFFFFPAAKLAWSTDTSAKDDAKSVCL